MNLLHVFIRQPYYGSKVCKIKFLLECKNYTLYVKNMKIKRTGDFLANAIIDKRYLETKM